MGLSAFARKQSGALARVQVPVSTSVLTPSAFSTPALTSAQLPSLPRPFTLYTKQSVIARGRDRPQLTFLLPPSPSSGHLFPLSAPAGLRWQLARLLTTQQKETIRAHVYDSTRMAVAAGLFVLAMFTGAFGMNYNGLDEQYPTPGEWSLLTKMYYLTGRAREISEIHEYNLADWHQAWRNYRAVVDRLEDQAGDGAGIVSHQPEGSSPSSADDSGNVTLPITTGFDISAKSEQWQRGYFDALMSLARVCEHLDDTVCDTSRNLGYRSKYIVGPNHPEPAPMPPWLPGPAPHEDDCEWIYDSPETVYVKVLAIPQFSTKQRMSAAIALGEWYSYKGLKGAAEDAFRWAIDIAVRPFEGGGKGGSEGGRLEKENRRHFSEQNRFIDRERGVILSDAPFSTPNIVQACTSLGVFLAQNGRAADALPIFLSSLRAVRAGSTRGGEDDGVDELDFESETGAKRRVAVTDVDALINFFNHVLGKMRQRMYPPPGPTGNEPIVRREQDVSIDQAKETGQAGLTKQTQKQGRPPSEVLAELGLLSYIGETMFATMPARRTDAAASMKQAAMRAEKCAQAAARTGREGGKKTVSMAALLLGGAGVGGPGGGGDEMVDRKRCEEFVNAGIVAVGNWMRMIDILEREEKGRLEGEHQRGTTGSWLRPWTWTWSRNRNQKPIASQTDIFPNTIPAPLSPELPQILSQHPQPKSQSATSAPEVLPSTSPTLARLGAERAEAAKLEARLRLLEAHLFDTRPKPVKFFRLLLRS